jgi:glycosyltransferase involved in cell wall biosynthesis
LEKIKLSIIIPTYNFQNYLNHLMISLLEASLVNPAYEIIFVNDASTDDTLKKLLEIQLKYPNASIKIINHTQNLGRFSARLTGAENANGEFLFFLDSRVILPKDSGLIINRLLSKEHCLMADVQINENDNPYSLYWKRTHHRIFAKTLIHRDKSFYINANNFHQNLTGTGALIVPKNIFIKHAYSFDPKMVLSDDNALIERIVKDCPILFDPQFFIFWEPRTDYLAFVLRMLERGPGFVEFHVFKKKGKYFIVFIIAIILLIIFILLSIKSIFYSIALIIIFYFMVGISTLLFSKNKIEFLQMLPIHLGTITFFSFGILWGLVINSWKFIKTGGTLGYRK